MTGRVFFNPIDVADVTETVQALFDDVDLVGNNLDVFASRWFYSALAYGCSFALIDFTRVEAVKSRAEEKALNARPYWVHIKPHQVLGIKTARVNGKQAITQFRYVVNEQVEDGEFGVKTVKHVYVYEIGTVKRAVLEQNGQLSIIQYGDQDLRYPLIIDGQIDHDILDIIGRDEAWVHQELEAQQTTVNQVYIGEYLNGRLIVHPYAQS